MHTQLIIYTRKNCCLCEEAKLVVERAGLSATPVDITTEIELLEKYRDTIPVLRHADQEIGWPFAEADVRRLVAA